MAICVKTHCTDLKKNHNIFILYIDLQEKTFYFFNLNFFYILYFHLRFFSSVFPYELNKELAEAGDSPD